MKRLLITMILGIWLFNVADAQSYFNNKATLNNCCVSLTSVVEAHNRYFTAGWGVDSINSLGGGYFIGINGVKFSVWDNQGRLIHDTAYQRSDSGSIYVVNKAMLELPNHTFLIPAEGGDTKGHKKLFLFCFDSTAHLLWQKEWDKPTNFPMIKPSDSWQMGDFKPDGHGNYLMLSSIARGLNSQTLLTKLDSGFNEIWHRDFGDNKYNSIAQSLIVESNGYTFGGYYSNLNLTTKYAFFQSELFRTDTAGNLMWHWQRDTSTAMSMLNHVVKAENGGYIYCGSKLAERRFYPQTSLFFWRPWIEKIDSTGKTVWNDTIASYATDYDRAGFTKLTELPGGDIAATGMITSGFDETDTGVAFYGMLVRFAPDGKIKWRRKYDYRGDTMYYRLYDMKHTSDGGYIMAGQNFDVLHETAATLPWQRAWLLKVDSNGCTSGNDPQCWPTAVPNEPKPVAGSYKVYPNPAAEQLQVSYSKENQADETFSLFDITGRRVKEAILSGQSKTITLDISSLQSGMYFYRVTSAAGILISPGKLLKE